MSWKFVDDPAWLEARKNFITASDIVKMLPVSPQGRKRSEATIKSNMLEVYADKNKKVLAGDEVSYGAMARGHVLEPYAVREYNRVGRGPLMHHWDSVLIADNRRGIAFSPDGLSIPMPEGCGVVMDIHGIDDCQVHGIEIKSYGAGRHYSTFMSNKEEVEERWQIAMAFTVMPQLKSMRLVNFNPSCVLVMDEKLYHRSDLAKEMAIIKDVVASYVDFEKEMDELVTSTALVTSLDYEGRSESEIMEENSSVMNPQM